ncbi:glycosyltransferase family 2 protein, partial [Escherichia coli]|nr:glycosyltransferase family 2 protein [Escherichia coli]
MKTWIFICMAVAILLWFLSTLRRKPSQKKGCIDAIIPAYNEGPCLAQSLDNLLRNPYFCRVICVNDGSMDNTEAVMAEVKRKWGDRFVAVTQKNTGKGGALMNGLNYATCDQVFLSDADTYVPPDQDGMGYMLAEIERGADAVGGIPSTALKGAGLLPHIRATVKLPMIVMKRTLQQLHIRATVKLPMIVMKRTLQQLLGGAPFIISGACGMFRTDVLRKFGFSDRTKVEDLDLTWTLVANGYRIRQANRCIVYPQECNSPREEWRRWRRWIVGYAVCM